MLQAHGQHAVECGLLPLPVQILPACHDARGARHVVIDARHRQTTLFAAGSALAAEDLGVDEHLARGVVFGHVDDDEALVPIDLGRGQADARRGVHSLEHVIDTAAQGRVKHAHRLRFGTQPRIGIFEDGQQCHARSRLQIAAKVLG